MISTTPHPDPHQVCAQSDCYWARIDATELGLRSPSDEQLGYLFERVLPVPLESVQTKFRRDTDRSFIACAMSRDQLESRIDERTISLCPDSIPEFLCSELAPQAFNLLHGEYEPKVLQALRRRGTLAVALAAMICTLLIVLGLNRRITQLEFQTAQIISQSESLMAESLGYGKDPAAIPNRSTLPAQFTGAVRLMQQTRTTALGDLMDHNSAADLAAVLSHWPSDLHVLTDSIIVSSETITIVAVVPDETALNLINVGFQNIPGWTRQAPSISSERDGIRVTIILDRSQNEAEEARP